MLRSDMTGRVAVVEIPEDRCHGREDGPASIDQCGCDTAEGQGFNPATNRCEPGGTTTSSEAFMCSLGPSPGWDAVKCAREMQRLEATAVVFVGRTDSAVTLEGLGADDIGIPVVMVKQSVGGQIQSDGESTDQVEIRPIAAKTLRPANKVARESLSSALDTIPAVSSIPRRLL